MLASDDDSEILCHDFLLAHWSDPRMEILGKRGERPFGSTFCISAVKIRYLPPKQNCKVQHKSLSAQAIQYEVDWPSSSTRRSASARFSLWEELFT